MTVKVGNTLTFMCFYPNIHDFDYFVPFSADTKDGSSATQESMIDTNKSVSQTRRKFKFSITFCIFSKALVSSRELVLVG
jgi:hypothetical protein